MKVRYYYNGRFYKHLRELQNAYIRDKGTAPMKAVKTRDSKGFPVLAYS